jgi:hypothetical protein
VRCLTHPHQCGHAARLEFAIAEGDIPGLLHVSAVGRRCGHRLTLPVRSRAAAALANFRAQIEGVIFANDNVLAARTEGIARFNRNPARTGVAEHLQPTHHAIAVQVAVMKLVLFDNVAIQTVKVFFR